MSPAGICVRILLLIEMISVLEAVADPSIGLGETFAAAPHAFERSVLLGLIVLPDTATMLGDANCICGILKGAPALFAVNSQVPAVFCATVFIPVVELYV